MSAIPAHVYLERTANIHLQLENESKSSGFIGNAQQSTVVGLRHITIY